MERKRVLFLCIGNTSRSPMAEAILRSRADDRYEALSAGLEPATIRSEVPQVLEEVGISADGLRSKPLDEYLGITFVHYVVTVCGEADERCPRVWPQGGKRLSWHIDDPAVVAGTEEQILNAYRRARDEIIRLVDGWLASEGSTPPPPGGVSA